MGRLHLCPAMFDPQNACTIIAQGVSWTAVNSCAALGLSGATSASARRSGSRFRTVVPERAPHRPFARLVTQRRLGNENGRRRCSGTIPELS
jgi:hypothetical protein